MEHVKSIEIRKGVDIGYRNDIQPINREGCVGASGIDKSFTLEMVLQLAYKINNKPNIIIKGGKNAKWYLKRYPKDVIDKEIEKEKWRDTSRKLMYIIDWNE
jgi:hypothetical protein